MSSSPYYASQGNHGPVIVQGHVVGTGGTTTTTTTYSNYTNHDASATTTAAAAAAAGGRSSHNNSNNNNNNNNNDDDHWNKGQPQPKRCNDAFFGILFYVHLGIMAYVTAIYTPQMYSDIASNYNNNNNNNNGGRSLMMSSMLSRWLQQQEEDDGTTAYPAMTLEMSDVYLILGISGMVGFIMSSLALSFMMTFASALIKVALWFNILMSGVVAIMALLAGVIPLALLCGLGFALTCYYAYCVWSRIPFAAANLVTAITAIRANLGVTVLAYLSLVLTFGWSMWWSVAFVSTTFVTNGCTADDGVCDTEPSFVVVFLFLVSFYWVLQVIKNVVHVTVAGTVGTWWFAPSEASSCCSRAIWDSYVRAMTFSFGSICFGSLIVAIIQAIREMVRQLREQDDGILICIAECLLGCIERLVEYFNQWAFVFVGLYGYTFMEAGTNVMTLFRSRGWTVIITDNLIDSVLTMVAMCVGVLTGVIGIFCAQAAGVDLSGGNAVAPFGLGFMFGFALSATLFSVVSSAVNTVIVCYAEAPGEFEQNHRKLSEEMRMAWRQAWPNDFTY